MKIRKKWFLGHTGSAALKAFSCLGVPTPITHPHYNAVIGPFRTKRGCLWAEKWGYLNPHFQHVNDAEGLAKREIKNERTTANSPCGV